MNLIEFLSSYFIIGLIWTAIVEYLTTRYKVGPPWVNGERVVQVIFFPWYVFLFLVNFIGSFSDNFDDTKDK